MGVLTRQKQREYAHLIMQALDLELEQIKLDIDLLRWWQWGKRKKYKKELKAYQHLIDRLAKTGERPDFKQMMREIPDYILKEIGWEEIKIWRNEASTL